MTLEKAAELAQRMDIHPLTLFVESFLLLDPNADLDSLFERIRHEISTDQNP